MSQPQADPPTDPPSPSASEQEESSELREIRQIIELMKDNGLSLFRLEREDYKIELRRGADAESAAVRAPAVIAPAAAAAPASAAAQGPPAAASPPESGSVFYITSPMVGSFYRAPGPGEKTFVSVGDVVEEGTTVCIIEAMKVMNEIKAERRGVITRVLVEDASAVQYDTPLFELRPA